MMETNKHKSVTHNEFDIDAIISRYHLVNTLLNEGGSVGLVSLP